MPYIFKQSVRSESKEIVDLLLNRKKRKNEDSCEALLDSSKVETSYIQDDSFSDENIEQSENNFLSSEESEFMDMNNDDMDIRREIALWAVEHTITNRATNDLLHILRKYFPFLPKDSRSLKQTPRDAPIISIQGGNYVHYGLKDCLTDYLSSATFKPSNIEGRERQRRRVLAA